MNLRLNVAPVLVVLWFLMSPPLFGDECQGQDFSALQQSVQELQSRYSRSVVKLKSGGEVGTAYLVDTENGLFMTAAHVVQPSLEDPSRPPRITGPEPFSGQRLEVLSHGPSDVDLALLKLSDTSLLEGLNPVEISLRQPRLGEQFLSLAWGRNRDSEERPRPGNPSFSRRVSSGLLEFNEQSSGVTPGDSGAPLIDMTGAAVGTLKKRQGTTVTFYTPMALAGGVLASLPPSDRVTSLDNSLRAGDLQRSDLVRLFIEPSTSPGSVDLIAWANVMKKSPAKYGSLADRFECPIVQVYWHRQLGSFAVDVSRFLPAPSFGRVLLREGVRAARESRSATSMAEVWLAESVSSLQASIAARVEEDQSAVVFAACQAGQSAAPSNNEPLRIRYSLGSGETYFTTELVATECPRGGDRVLSNLYRDYALASLELSRILEDGARSASLLDSARHSVEMAVLTVGPGQLQANNFATLGDILLESADSDSKSGDSESAIAALLQAAAAFSSSYSGGKRNAWVEGNWQESLSRLERLTGESQDLAIGEGIGESPMVSLNQIEPSGLEYKM